MVLSFVLVELDPVASCSAEPTYWPGAQKVAELKTQPFLALRVPLGDIPWVEERPDFVKKSYLFPVSTEKPDGQYTGLYLTLNDSLEPETRILNIIPPLRYKGQQLYVQTWTCYTEVLSPGVVDLPLPHHLDEDTIESFFAWLRDDVVKRYKDFKSVRSSGGEDEVRSNWSTWSNQSVPDWRTKPFTKTLHEMRLLLRLISEYSRSSVVSTTAWVRSLRMNMSTYDGISFAKHVCVHGTLGELDDTVRRETSVLHSMKIPFDGEPDPEIPDEVFFTRCDSPFPDLPYVQEPSGPVQAANFKVVAFDMFGTLIDRDTALYQAIRLILPGIKGFLMHKATQLFLDCEARESNSCPNLSPLHVSRNALAEMCHRMRLSTDKTAIDEATRCLQKTMLHTDSASCVQKLRSAGFVVLALPYPESLCASHGNYPIGVPSCSFEPGRLHRQNPSMFVVLLEHLKKTLPGITPADVVIVSSARHQTVEVAVKLGFQTALIRRPQHLESLVDLESAPPTYIADSMAHLCTVLCQRIPVPSRLKDPRDWRPDPFRVQEIYQDRGILAEGSGGKVYDAINVVTGENMVIKIDISEKVIQKECTLPYEAQAYRILRGHRGILEPRWSGHIGGGNEEAYAIVFEKLSPDLSKLCTFCRGRLSMKTICMLALQLIDIIEFVHSRGLIIRDIKPENCATGTDIDCSIVYMFDFGMAKLYQDPVTKKHIPYREGFIGTGTARYASHNAHFGRELSRRDDIEMLGHSLLYFYHDRLPWQGIYAQSTDDKLMRIGQMKTGKTFEDLLQRSPPELAAYFHHCRSLDFEDSPDYGYLKQQFTVRMKREGWQNDGKFDWIESSHSEDGTLLPEEYKWKEWPTS